MIHHPYTQRQRRRLLGSLFSRSGGVDLPSIMIGVAVVAILTGGILATVFGAIPWAQDNAAKQNVVAVRTAQGVAANTTGSFQDTTGLNKAGFLESTAGIGIATNGKPGEKGCFVTVMQSKSGKMFYGTDTMTEAAQLKDGTKDPCVLGAKLQDAINEAGGKVVAGKDTYTVSKAGGGDLWDASNIPLESWSTHKAVPGLAGKTITDSVVGTHHTCVIADNEPWCWGHQGAYRLGNNVSYDVTTTASRAILTGLPKGAKLHSLSSSYATTCLIAAEKLYCWGNNSNGQINPATVPANAASPQLAPPMKDRKVTSAQSGSWNTCAVSEGELWCWGQNSNGINANGVTSSGIVPAAKVAGALKNKTVTNVYMGKSNGCAVADGSLYCWGAGGYGQLTAAYSSPVALPAKIPGLPKGTITDVGISFESICALIDGNTWCWGRNLYGEAGNSTNTQVKKPYLVKGALQGKTVESISAGFTSTCAIASGEAYCWGDNTQGQLGNGTKVASSVPVKVVIPAGQRAVDISVGQFSSLVSTIPK